MKWHFVQNPFSVELLLSGHPVLSGQPLLSGHPVLSGHPAIPCRWLFNTGSTVLCTSVGEF